jgi:sugar lactone lactonase YvrE
MFGNLKQTVKQVSISLAIGCLLLNTTGCAKKAVTPANPYAATPSTGTNYSSGSSYDSGYSNPYQDPNNVSSQQNNLPTGAITGRIVDSLTSMGLAGARIEVMGIRPAITTVTDASGNFTLPNVPQGRQVLVVTKKEYTSLVGNSNIVVDVAAGNTTTAPSINLIPDKASVANGFVKAFDGFTHPRGLTINKTSNELFIVDIIGIGGFFSFDRAEIKKINSDGGIMDNFGSRWFSTTLSNIDAFRLLKKSTGIGVDAGGNIYVADTGNDAVKKYGPTGKYISALKKEFKNLFDIAVLSSGDFVVSDPGNSRVVLLDSSMNIKMDNIMGAAGSEGIRGVSVDNADNIYVIDESAKPGEVIKKFDKNGNKLNLTFGIIGGLEPSYFNNPTDIAIDSRNGDIYVVDTGNNRIQRFNAEGNFLSEFGQFGSENGSFNAPWGIAIDNQGFVFISDSKNGRIQKFMPGRFGQNTY